VRRAAPGSTLLASCGLALSVAVVGGVAWAYDAGYRAVTGEAFWAVNLGRQLGVASAVRSPALGLEKVRNVGWDGARVLWFAFPWSLVVAWRSYQDARGAATSPPGGAREGLRFAQLFTVLAVLAFSLSDRRADRYLFPVYYALGAAGAVIALRMFRGLR